MSRRIILFIFIAGLTATFLFKPQSKSSQVLGMPNFTVVTRTPTPAPPTPEPPTATRSNPGPTSQPNDTATPIADTATPTLIPVTLVATPSGGFMPTAVACGFPPTVQAKNTVRVRSGPGTDYDIIGQMVYLETRPVVGRAADSKWWVIQFSNDEMGWVADAVVKVHGNTSGIPIAGAPPIDGEEPTPGPLWNPTPNPGCPITPSATPAPTETAAKPVATATPAPTDTSTPENSGADVENTTPEAEDSPAAEAEDATPTSAATSVVPAGAETAVDAQATAAPTAAPLDGDVAQNAVNALPCLPAVIGLALLGFLAFRRFF